MLPELRNNKEFDKFVHIYKCEDYSVPFPKEKINKFIMNLKIKLVDDERAYLISHVRTIDQKLYKYLM